MKKNQRETEEAAEQALGSLDNLAQAEVNEFLYTRVLSRIQQNRREMAGKSRRIVLRLSLALGLFAGINGLSFYVLSKTPTTDAKTSVTGGKAFAQAYGLNNEEYSY